MCVRVSARFFMCVCVFSVGLCVCSCVCVFVRVFCLCVCVYVSMPVFFVCACVCVHAFMHVYVCV